MSMKPHGLEPIPEETRRLVHRLSPKGTLVTQLRDALGPIYSDEQFAHLFPQRGRPAEAPWRLALVTVLQAIEGLTDRQAAAFVRTRIDWLYALALPLDDPGFDYSILTDFRQRLLKASNAPMPRRCWRACARSAAWKAWERGCVRPSMRWPSRTPTGSART